MRKTNRMLLMFNIIASSILRQTFFTLKDSKLGVTELRIEYGRSNIYRLLGTCSINMGWYLASLAIFRRAFRRVEIWARRAKYQPILIEQVPNNLFIIHLWIINPPSPPCLQKKLLALNSRKAQSKHSKDPFPGKEWIPMHCCVNQNIRKNAKECLVCSKGGVA